MAKSNKDQPQQQVESQQRSNQKTDILISLVLIAVMIFVFFGSSEIKLKINGAKQTILAARTKILVEEPIKIQKPKKNLMCPQAKGDLDSCLEKREKCKKTEQEFIKASKQFTTLIDDCAVSNNEHQRINNEMEDEIVKMEEALKQYENLQ